MNLEKLTNIKTEFKGYKEILDSGDYEKAYEMLDKLLKTIEESLDERRAAKVNSDAVVELTKDSKEEIYMSLNHVMEYYLYEVYFEPDAEVKTLDLPVGEYYRTFGELCQNMGKYKAAEDAYKKALSWNPVDLDSYLGLAESYKYQNMLNRFLEVTKQAYRYCCTRATMARYYRNIAYYYLSSYKPEIARDAYQYSNVYYHTDNADSELKYIEEALEKKTPDIDIRRIQKVFTEENVEPGPDSKTIGIIYRVGELMMQDNELALARDCFSICYDITQEQQLGAILDQLEEALKEDSNGNE